MKESLLQLLFCPVDCDVPVMHDDAQKAKIYTIFGDLKYTLHLFLDMVLLSDKTGLD